MQNHSYSIAVIFILLLICSSCSITRQTSCPTFSNKTEKVHKPLFSKKSSSKKREKKQCAKISDQRSKKDTKNIRFSKIESIISQIKTSDLTALSNNDIVLNLTDITQNTNDITPSFTESKLQKFIYKRIEKKSKKVLKKINKNNEKRNKEESANCENVISKKEHKTKQNKIVSNTSENSTNEPETHDLAIVSLLAGILSYVSLLLVPFTGGISLLLTLAMGISSIAFGFTARKKIKENPTKYKGNGMALTGLILGLVLFGVIITLFLLLLAFLANSGPIG